MSAPDNLNKNQKSIEFDKSHKGLLRNVDQNFNDINNKKDKKLITVNLIS